MIQLNRDKLLSEGIYDATDIEYKEISGDHVEISPNGDILIHTDSVDKFGAKYPQTYIAFGMGTGRAILLARKPTKMTEEYRIANGMNRVGSGFSRGSTNLISNCPKTVLIIANRS